MFFCVDTHIRTHVHTHADCRFGSLNISFFHDLGPARTAFIRVFAFWIQLLLMNCVAALEEYLTFIMIWAPLGPSRLTKISISEFALGPSFKATDGETYLGFILLGPAT